MRRQPVKGLYAGLHAGLHASALAFVAIAAIGGPPGRAEAATVVRSAARSIPMTDRVIVKLKDAYRPALLATQPARAMAVERTDALSASAGIALRAVRPMSDDAQVLALPGAFRTEAVQAVVDRLRRDPTVEYAYVDVREHLTAVPNDPLFSQQTYLQAPTTAAPLVASVNAPGAWNITTGTGAAVIAIVDGGVRFDHPDLANRFYAGYDFVSADCTIGTTGCTTANQFTTANDGDGRDSDASDPGDWITAADAASNPFLSDCDPEDSSWHGTHVAGVIGAAGNNSLGVTGLNWGAAMLSVRVSGRCGAYRSDVIDGMRWAAGLPVPNVPANTTPARIVNISLGSAGTCASSAYSQPVADVLATGAIIVAAAGNEDASIILPAACPGVVSVGAVRGDGTRAVYSNTGAGLTIMAPGGDYTSATNDRIGSTSNAGRTTPVAYSTAGYYTYEAGTSFSAPIVSGVVSLMLSANANLTSAQVIDILRTTARPFTSVAGYATCVAGGTGNADNTVPCNCTTAVCGAGYVDANAAVARAYALSSAGTTTTTPAQTSSGSGGGGGGGAIDPTALVVLTAVAVATRRVRRHAHRRDDVRERRPHDGGLRVSPTSVAAAPQSAPAAAPQRCAAVTTSNGSGNQNAVARASIASFATRPIASAAPHRRRPSPIGSWAGRAASVPAVAMPLRSASKAASTAFDRCGPRAAREQPSRGAGSEKRVQDAGQAHVALDFRVKEPQGGIDGRGTGDERRGL